MSKHEHECEKCGHVWEHDPDTFQKDASGEVCCNLWKKEHTCVKCGEEQYTKRGCGGLDVRKLCMLLTKLTQQVVQQKKAKNFKTKYEGVKNTFIDLF